MHKRCLSSVQSRFLASLVVLLGLTGWFPATAWAQRALSDGQYLYLPIYSFVRHGDADRSGATAQLPVSALVSIHNTDMQRPLRVMFARFFSTQGDFLRNAVPAPRTLKPMETMEFMVERRDVAGGSGSNFVIQWQADTPVSPPLVQALHVELQTNRALSFITEAVVIAR